MFCANCGKQIGPGTNFCPACGTRISSPETHSAHDPSQGAQEPAPTRGFNQGSTSGSWSGTSNASPGKLVRPRSPRVLGGVCAAFAIHFGWNLDVVRIIAVILGLFYGFGVLAYLACWILLPEAQYALPPQSR